VAIQDPNELEKVLLQRAQAKARAQAQYRHIHQAIDSDGQVKVWELASGRSYRLWPVDAAAVLARGLVSLQRPTPVAEAAGETNSQTPTPPPAPEPEPVAGEIYPETPPAAVPEPTAPKAKGSRGKTKESGFAAPGVPAPFDVPLT
jgi:hypothetical protein